MSNLNQYKYKGDVGLVSVCWDVEQGKLNNMMLKIHGVYKTQNEAQKEAGKIIERLEHRDLKIIEVDTGDWFIIPLNGNLPCDKNMTYDQRVKKILLNSLEAQLDIKQKESNKLLEKVRSNLENNPIEFTSDFMNNDMFQQYIDQLLQQQGLDKEFQELMMKKKQQHTLHNERKNMLAVQRGKENILKAREKLQQELQEQGIKPGDLQIGDIKLHKGDETSQQTENNQKTENEQNDALKQENPEQILQVEEEKPIQEKQVQELFNQEDVLEKRMDGKELIKQVLEENKKIKDTQVETLQETLQDQENNENDQYLRDLATQKLTQQISCLTESNLKLRNQLQGLQDLQYSIELKDLAYIKGIHQQILDLKEKINQNSTFIEQNEDIVAELAEIKHQIYELDKQINKNVEQNKNLIQNRQLSQEKKKLLQDEQFALQLMKEIEQRKELKKEMHESLKQKIEIMNKQIAQILTDKNVYEDQVNYNAFLCLYSVLFE